MAAGDANRVWFTELVEMLSSDWDPSLNWEEAILLCTRLDRLLKKIRAERNILPAMMWCSTCHARVRSGEPRVSVRAMILALGRFGITTKEQTLKLERAWAKHRKECGLDLYGQTEGEGATSVPETHPDHRPLLTVVTRETELKGVYPGPGVV